MVKHRVPATALQRETFRILKERLDGKELETTGAQLHVYDEVPQDAVLPWIELGRHRYTGWGTKSGGGWVGGQAIECFSQYRGLAEVNEIVDLIVEAISEEAPDLEADGFTVIPQEYDEASLEDVMQGVDQVVMLKHGVVRPRFKILQCT